MYRVLGAAAVAVLACCALSRAGHAGSELFAGPSTCTGINCGSTVLNSTVEADAFGNEHPVVFQLKGTPGDCLRVDVTYEGADLQAVLVSPSGKTWSNDDRGYPDLRPLIVADVDAVGFYTLAIGRYNGSGSRTNLTVAYGQYATSNPNCAGATTPFVTARHTK